MNYIYSTLTNATTYNIYIPNDEKQLPIIQKRILINGGANLTTKHLVTPRGSVTEVNDEDLEALENDYHFKEHIKNGFITIERRQKEIEKVVKGMSKKDKSAPLIKEDFDKIDNITVGLPV